MRLRFLSLIVLCAAFALGGCGEFSRASDASDARHKMVGMSKEDVLTCMGVPKQKTHVGETEVWLYHSTDGLSVGGGASHKQSYKYGADVFGTSQHYKYFCTINVVMKNDRVTVVHYTGPTGGWLAPDEQCGYEVTHCATPD